jgi:hypothetical protein
MPIDFNKTEEENRAIIEAERKKRERAQFGLFGEFESTCMLDASKISEETIEQIPKNAKYLLLFDTQMGSYLLGNLGAVLGSHAKLIGAINGLALHNWRCVSITAREKNIYALMER